MIKPRFFSLDELVCEDVYNFYGQIAWQFFDVKLLVTLDRLREKFNKPIFINDWQIHGSQSQSGFRCLKCSIVQAKILSGEMYCSAHMTGQAADFTVQGLLAEEVRQWIVKNANLLPYPVRLEEGVSWVHLDTRDNGIQKVTLFKP
jgi:hypothetical protein